MHHFRFSEQTPRNVSENGYRIEATKSNFPALRNMALYKLSLNPQAIREPHWHANADELGYCIQGEVLISLYTDKNIRAAFVVHAGDAFFIPSGALHAIENIGYNTAELLLQL